MLNAASPYRLVEWFAWWPAKRVVGRVQQAFGVPPERRHAARRTGIRALPAGRLTRLMKDRGLQPVEVRGFDATLTVPPLNRIVARLIPPRDPPRPGLDADRWPLWLSTGYVIVGRKHSEP
jgi:hypothetical protein